MDTATTPVLAKLTAIAPQFLVNDLGSSAEYYCRRLGFVLDFTHDGFYASVSRDGCAIHLKEAPKTEADRAHRRQHEHLDAHIAVRNATALHGELLSRGARITRPLDDRPWACRDFYVEDPDGYILCFSEPTGATSTAG
jgi:catechol 2,3-dioxygenase-like lactoylglutathione lyase family enzyme